MNVRECKASCSLDSLDGFVALSPFIASLHYSHIKESSKSNNSVSAVEHITSMKLLVSLLLVSCSGALVLPSRSLAAPATTRLLSSQSSTQQPVEELKHEIEDLKAEALRRMQALKSELMEADAAEKEKETETDSVFSPQVAVSNVVHKEPKANRMEVQSTDETDLLDGTVWKVMLNIGREQGAFDAFIRVRVC